uniref:Thioredoxin n=1 Tax=uncultured Thiotrichaceae bacterium TaxID=298394 RepID=A0A6S6T5U2_9GAMM|nr:MAG: Thioredoxin [uncultured Thiotrichaceae bacterium]
MSQTTAKKRILYYVHDPMCSWCYGFRKTWQQLQAQLPEDIEVRYIVGGLAPDSSDPMPQEMQNMLQATWQRITQSVPGTQFNFDFWTKNTPRRSTYPSCRAVLAAKQQGASKERAMTEGIQDAYYQQALNPSDDDTLIKVAESIGLDGQVFAEALNSAEIQQALQQELQFARSIGGDSFPSLIMEQDGEYHTLMLSYTDANKLLAQL